MLIVDVPPGRHRVQARIDWTGSESIDVDVAAGVDVHLVVETTGTAFEFWQAFTRSGYLCLRQA